MEGLTLRIRADAGTSRQWVYLLIAALVGLIHIPIAAQVSLRTTAGSPIRRLPDTGQTTDYTATLGEDADYALNVPALTRLSDGTVTDHITGLMWPAQDGGECTIEAAETYCDTLTLGGYADWRMPTAQELFGILHHDRLNPALDTSAFVKTSAEYWWSRDRRVGDTTRIWVTNAGGGIGPHPRGETVSAGGTKQFHVRAVRDVTQPTLLSDRFLVLGDSTVLDRSTGLIWQRYSSASTVNWEGALTFAESLTLGGNSDWRLPNVKELQSINDVSLSNPSVDRTAFPAFVTGRYWTSTSQYTTPTRAWNIDVQYGIASYELKSATLSVIAVRGGYPTLADSIDEVAIPGGTYEMGDHFGFVDPSHPSDEVPVHGVTVSPFLIGRTETTNQQFLAFLNDALSSGTIEVRNHIVYAAGDSEIYCYTNEYEPHYSIGATGTSFFIADQRASHPMVGVMWYGAAAYCNWLSARRGLEACYDLATWTVDLTRNGYRLPTEAEWEYAGRGGHVAPYLIYPSGNAVDVTKANLPASGDPYETGLYPHTTPVGFYDGTLKLKADYQWPGAATSYQTSDGRNGFGLFDMQGNVWELLNDWYGQNYYSSSPAVDPPGPVSGFIMPDGKPYRGMRGGNWYNGLVTNGVNDGHSRVANRNPSYYRGPQDPNHPWYHIGFRVARRGSGATGVDRERRDIPHETRLLPNYPNPFNPQTTVVWMLDRPAHVTVTVIDLLGREVAVLADEPMPSGMHTAIWKADNVPSGVYVLRMKAADVLQVRTMLLVK